MIRIWVALPRPQMTETYFLQTGPGLPDGLVQQ
ncbi:MAG: hypothetical protein N838_19755 [Thiohalocapsa sp. PB-PSB1]|nr:MAG: hypothetical protein N838_19755 [Thiohalocapsa sp. PB-PSB1]